MSIKLYDLNMKEITQRGIKWLELIPDPPASERTSESIWNGSITLGKRRLSRKLTARLFFRGADTKDYKLLRDEIFATLNPLKEFYVVDTDVPGKRWLVDVDAQTLKRSNRVAGEWEVVFYSAKGLAESIGTTLDPFTFDYGKWAYGMGLLEDATAQDYVHSTTPFSIFNAGHEEVDPRESKLVIKLTSSTGTSSDLKITNTTTGDMFQYKGVFQAGDIITLDGVQFKRNNLNIVGSTNLGLITLKPGTNNFKIEGITGGFEISFEFRYLYL